MSRFDLFLRCAKTHSLPIESWVDARRPTSALRKPTRHASMRPDRIGGQLARAVDPPVPTGCKTLIGASRRRVEHDRAVGFSRVDKNLNPSGVPSVPEKERVPAGFGSENSGHASFTPA